MDVSEIVGLTIPCPCCGEERGIELTKNNKPYVHCDPCGVQVFVRAKPGVERFVSNVVARARTRLRESGAPAREAVQQSRRTKNAKPVARRKAGRPKYPKVAGPTRAIDFTARASHYRNQLRAGR